MCTICRDHEVTLDVHGLGATVMKDANFVKHMARDPHKKATGLHSSKQLPQKTMPDARQALFGYNRSRLWSSSELLRLF